MACMWKNEWKYASEQVSDPRFYLLVMFLIWVLCWFVWEIGCRCMRIGRSALVGIWTFVWLDEALWILFTWVGLKNNMKKDTVIKPKYEK